MATIDSAPVVKTSGGNAAFHNFHNDFAHIQDPNERRRLALAEIDKAPFGWYHIRACVVAGIGFFTDSYDVCSPAVIFFRDAPRDKALEANLSSYQI
jgi:PHS family inorganic phosphate transporter-like MFS transporter